MSEYQYVAFRAIDRPVHRENLKYMRSQSSRAAITPWSFTNEYHYGDFGGDTLEMLRRGYDFHFHYANFGIRDLFIRFPYGLPNRVLMESYLGESLPHFEKDRNGDGGTLVIEPYHESGELDELWDLGELLDRLVPLRAELLGGDLRPLYLAHLAMACDANNDPEEITEAPIPAGLNELTDAQQALAELYELDKSLLKAAARLSPPMEPRKEPLSQYQAWLEQVPQAQKDEWLSELMASPDSLIRGYILAEFRASGEETAWPTVPGSRTIAELQHEAQGMAEKAKQKEAAKAERQRQKRLAELAANPEHALNETESLVKQRGRIAYQQIAQLLAELREALAGSEQADLPEQQAQKLKAENPTLRTLATELKQQGFLAKSNQNKS